ncbi:hypothetical protein CRG98_045805 [Punica granatum]|uniref:Uncharacterized protein n=1 Tax=Punica granatum TaxID=22663 RepID=A0A2I0HRB1_PUNGR|nr:hypothetical protein CRG98_045805 [Punica granatum]
MGPGGSMGSMVHGGRLVESEGSTGPRGSTGLKVRRVSEIRQAEEVRLAQWPWMRLIGSQRFDGPRRLADSMDPQRKGCLLRFNKSMRFDGPRRFTYSVDHGGRVVGSRRIDRSRRFDGSRGLDRLDGPLRERFDGSRRFDRPRRFVGSMDHGGRIVDSRKIDRSGRFNCSKGPRREALVGFEGSMGLEGFAGT